MEQETPRVIFVAVESLQPVILEWAIRRHNCTNVWHVLKYLRLHNNFYCEINSNDIQDILERINVWYVYYALSLKSILLLSVLPASSQSHLTSQIHIGRRSPASARYYTPPSLSTLKRLPEPSIRLLFWPIWWKISTEIGKHNIHLTWYIQGILADILLWC